MRARDISHQGCGAVALGGTRLIFERTGIPPTPPARLKLRIRSSGLISLFLYLETNLHNRKKNDPESWHKSESPRVSSDGLNTRPALLHEMCPANTRQTASPRHPQAFAQKHSQSKQ